MTIIFRGLNNGDLYTRKSVNYYEHIIVIQKDYVGGVKSIFFGVRNNVQHSYSIKNPSAPRTVIIDPTSNVERRRGLVVARMPRKLITIVIV